ncbi:hypothetical protein FA048_09320 [Pedobacter polaris]|uniref:Copper-binding protein MbnP-like domain-containing protein n=1 Tax=Pedobacter polaris TaxID=2571273 RepID=A0A4U1CQT0_9SPHI|nr:MbnP family protein [Pedobacter polaris]TKC10381.1 hypothetical protein FA048_09320 [Pedobacter polaris]
MNIKNILVTLFAILTLGFTSCKKEKQQPDANQTGSFTLEFDNTVNGAQLMLNTQNYTNANGDSYTISTFKYYVSNVKLSKADGTTYSIPESYILVDASKPSSSLISIADVPEGDYTKINFTIGVNKERNLAGAQTGALDPALGMFWTWNSGYIFVKLEGNSPQSTAANHTLTFHIGGIVDPNNTIRTFSTDFNVANPLRIREDKKPQLHFKVNAGSLFTGKQNVNFAQLNFTMGGANSVIVANNYVSGLFELDHIHN